jgi:hypothetical protein
VSTPSQSRDRIVRLNVELDFMSPTIWRRIELPLTATLRQLHEAIQAAMLFENTTCSIAEVWVVYKPLFLCNFLVVKKRPETTHATKFATGGKLRGGRETVSVVLDRSARG